MLAHAAPSGALSWMRRGQMIHGIDVLCIAPSSMALASLKLLVAFGCKGCQQLCNKPLLKRNMHKCKNLGFLKTIDFTYVCSFCVFRGAYKARDPTRRAQLILEAVTGANPSPGPK